MTDQEDIALLREWADLRSEAAFRALVERYGALVWGTALRRTSDRGMAEEAVQQVFSDLARKAGVLAGLRRPLGPWLHRSAVYEAVQVLRREIRHRDRMKNYALADPGPSAPDPWAEVRPQLDEAINSLNETDRRVLLLHWFERRTFAEVAEQTGCTPGAAQRRGLRALDKLAAALKRRGPAVSATVLAAGLTAQLTPSVPAAVSAAMYSAAKAAAGGVSGAALAFHQCLNAMASAKLVTAAVVLLCAALPVGVRLAASEWSGAGPDAAPVVTGTTVVSLPAAPVPPRPAAPVDLNVLRRTLERLAANPGDYPLELELRRFMFSLGAGEFEGVAELLASLPDGTKNALGEVCHALFARWAELDPGGAAEAAAGPRGMAFGLQPVRGVYVTWAFADFDAAWAWIKESAPGAAAFEMLTTEAVEGITAVRGGGGDVMNRVDVLADKELARRLKSRALRMWGRHGAPADALMWAEAVPDEAERTWAIAETIEQIGGGRPDAALRWLGSIKNPAQRLKAGRNVLRPWLMERPPGQWQRPPDPIQELEVFVGTWPPEMFGDTGAIMTMHDTATAVNLVRRLPEGESREQFVSGMLRSAASGEAALVLPVLPLSGEDTLVRDPAFGRFAETLTRQNPRAAADWIAGLPEESALRAPAEARFSRVTGSSAAEYLSTAPK